MSLDWKLTSVLTHPTGFLLKHYSWPLRLCYFILKIFSFYFILLHFQSVQSESCSGYLIWHTERIKVGIFIFHQKVPHMLLTMDAADIISWFLLTETTIIWLCSFTSFHLPSRFKVRMCKLLRGIIPISKGEEHILCVFLSLLLSRTLSIISCAFINKKSGQSG